MLWYTEKKMLIVATNIVGKLHLNYFRIRILYLSLRGNCVTGVVFSLLPSYTNTMELNWNGTIEKWLKHKISALILEVSQKYGVYWNYWNYSHFVPRTTGFRGSDVSGQLTELGGRWRPFPRSLRRMKPLKGLHVNRRLTGASMRVKKQKNEINPLEQKH